ncbi:MAG: DUF6434 domain-containing protein [Pseudomonadota bacterium]
MKETRPDITTITTSKELRRWYWYRSELAAECRRLKLKQQGGKFTLLDRIAHFLDTGERQWPGDVMTKPASKFDWHSAELMPETVITDSYRNSQNVRRFFKSQLGDDFKFNVSFMAWMKENVGATLTDACKAYEELKALGFPAEIPDHNQFNLYQREFLADNPELGLEDARRYWFLKIQRPSETGRHEYDRSDLDVK